MNETIQFNFPTFLKPAFTSKAKYIIIVAGRRTGKTYNGVQWLLANLMAKGNARGLHVDTTQENLLKYQKRYYKPILGSNWNYPDWVGERYKPTIQIPRGSYIDFASAEKPQNMEGFEYDFILLNEAGIIFKRPELWTNTIMPMAKNAKVMIIGTPKGKNLFHQLYLQGLDDPEYQSFKFTAFNSPYWNKEQLEKIKSKIPLEVWQQEYLADFTEGSGSVFRDIQKCVKIITNKRADIMAVDLAKHQDFTVIMAGDSRTKEITYMDRFNQIDWGFQKIRIFTAWETLGKPRCIIDSTGVGDAIFDDLANHGMILEPFKFTSNTKNDIIRNLSVAIDNQNIFYPNDKLLLGELESFGYEVSRMGNIRYNAPEGLHDDIVIALALLNKLFNHTIDINIIWV